jgi:Fe-S-cluster containining protein
MDQKLADKIIEEYEEVTLVFSRFQNKTKLSCREHCGKCCFKKNIYCSPMEMLPLGLKLLADKKAEEYLDLCLSHTEDNCVLLKITDKENGFGYCSQYAYRPFVCRAFGVAARIDKKGNPEVSTCKIIKEDHSELFEKLLKTEFPEMELPILEQWRKRLDAIDPRFLEEHLPIYKSLSIILEKLLFIESLQS